MIDEAARGDVETGTIHSDLAPAHRREPAPWLALAFVALLGALVLIATTGVGEAAATFLGGQPIVCGGP